LGDILFELVSCFGLLGEFLDKYVRKFKLDLFGVGRNIILNREVVLVRLVELFCS
jgi:hypothetical protein